MKKRTRNLNIRLLLLPMLGASLLLGGCATKKYTRAEVNAAEGRVNERVDGVQTQVEENQTAIRGNQRSIEANKSEIQATSKTAQDALDRAVAAGKLAQGKFLYETVLSNDAVKFAFEKADLTDDAKAVLDQFTSQLKAENKNVYVEIQGHTDASGEAEYNHQLGLERAEAVRRHLSRSGIPLHRMSVISYGEDAPVADNGTREGRSQNRRVVLVVLE